MGRLDAKASQLPTALHLGFFLDAGTTVAHGLCVAWRESIIIMVHRPQGLFRSLKRKLPGQHLLLSSLSVECVVFCTTGLLHDVSSATVEFSRQFHASACSGFLQTEAENPKIRYSSTATPNPKLRAPATMGFLALGGTDIQ